MNFFFFFDFDWELRTSYREKAVITDSKLYQPHSIWMLPIIVNLSYFSQFILGTKTKRNQFTLAVWTLIWSNLTLRQSVEMCHWMQYIHFNHASAWLWKLTESKQSKYSRFFFSFNSRSFACQIVDWQSLLLNCARVELYRFMSETFISSLFLSIFQRKKKKIVCNCIWSGNLRRY